MHGISTRYLRYSPERKKIFRVAARWNHFFFKIIKVNVKEKKNSTSRWIDFLNEPNLEKQLCLEAKSRKIVQGAKLKNFARFSTKVISNEERN